MVNKDSYDINLRIIELIEHFGVSQNKFGLSIGVSSSRISNITKLRNRPDYELLSSILLTYPSISSDWLMLGKGGMEKNGNESSVLSEPGSRYETPKEEINHKCLSCADKEQLIQVLKKTNQELKEQLLEAKKDKDFLKGIIKDLSK